MGPPKTRPVVWYSHLLKNFPQFVMIYTVKGFGLVNKAEVDGLGDGLDGSSDLQQHIGHWIFSVLSFCLFILFIGFSRQEHRSGLPFPSPADHILSELSTMIHLSWVALCGMAHSFIELDKAVVHVIRLVSFL